MMKITKNLAQFIKLKIFLNMMIEANTMTLHTCSKTEIKGRMGEGKIT